MALLFLPVGCSESQEQMSEAIMSTLSIIHTFYMCKGQRVVTTLSCLMSVFRVDMPMTLLNTCALWIYLVFPGVLLISNLYTSLSFLFFIVAYCRFLTLNSCFDLLLGAKTSRHRKRN